MEITYQKSNIFSIETPSFNLYIVQPKNHSAGYIILQIQQNKRTDLIKTSTIIYLLDHLKPQARANKTSQVTKPYIAAPFSDDA